MIALAGHGQGDKPSEEVLRGVKSFLALYSVQVESGLGSTNTQVFFVRATRR